METRLESGFLISKTVLVLPTSLSLAAPRKEENLILVKPGWEIPCTLSYLEISWKLHLCFILKSMLMGMASIIQNTVSCFN